MATERGIATRQTTEGILVALAPEKKLDEYHELGYNVIVAAMNLHVTDPRMMQDFKILMVNPDPKMGEVFETGYNSGKFALMRPALERIAICAGINWDPRETKLVRAEREYVVFQAVGYMRSDSGETITLTGTKEIDMSVVESEMRAEQTVKVFNAENTNFKTWNRKVMYEELSPEMQAKVDGLTRREVTVFRKHKLARAETGAKNRAIRSMGLKSTYTAEELAKPFVIARIVPNPENPMVRASMRTGALALYGEEPERPRRRVDVEGVEAVGATEESQEPDAQFVPGEGRQASPETAPPSDLPVDLPARSAGRSAPQAEQTGASPNPTAVALEHESRRVNRYRDLVRYIGTEYGLTKVAELSGDQIDAAAKWMKATA